ncbi:MAG: hypothetical protein JWM10_994 [Myxococcaceae bacterium]|nr:hypothetical protein [Myxococcaceae bacterium]
MIRFALFALGFLLAILAFAMVAKLFQVCWNVAAHAMFHGPQIGYRPAVAVLVVLSIVASMFRRGAR